MVVWLKPCKSRSLPGASNEKAPAERRGLFRLGLWKWPARDRLSHAMSRFARSAVALRRLLRKTAEDRDVRWGTPTEHNQARDGPATPSAVPAVDLARRAFLHPGSRYATSA